MVGGDMDQMEAFTEIMVSRFYPAWPGVSPLFLKNSCLAFPEKSFHGAVGSRSPAIIQPIYPRPGFLFHL